MRRVMPNGTAKERYGDDRAQDGAKKRPTMIFISKKEKLIPSVGCSTDVVQMPVFIALLWGVFNGKCRITSKATFHVNGYTIFN